MSCSHPCVASCCPNSCFTAPAELLLPPDVYLLRSVFVRTRIRLYYRVLTPRRHANTTAGLRSVRGSKTVTAPHLREAGSTTYTFIACIFSFLHIHSVLSLQPERGASAALQSLRHGVQLGPHVRLRRRLHLCPLDCGLQVSAEEVIEKAQMAFRSSFYRQLTPPTNKGPYNCCCSTIQPIMKNISVASCFLFLKWSFIAYFKLFIYYCIKAGGRHLFPFHIYPLETVIQQ